MTTTPKMAVPPTIRAALADSVKLGVSTNGQNLALILESSGTTGESVALVRELHPLKAISLANAMISGAMAIIDDMVEADRPDEQGVSHARH